MNNLHPFLREVLPHALTVHRQSGIPASVMLAQAALESGYGQSQLAQQGKNLFGVKAGASWKGPTLSLPTLEYVNGAPVKVQARWRKYSDYAESFRDLARVYYNGRYDEALAYRRQPAEFITRAGRVYATDPLYASKVLSIISRYDLSRYDLPPSQWQLDPALVPPRWRGQHG